MRRSSALAVSALAITVALGLAGCSGNAGPSAPEIDATPASGDTVTSDGYSYSIPEGWAEQDASIAMGADTVALDSEIIEDFANNVNVVVSPAGALSPDDIEDTVVDELEAGGGEDVEVLDRVQVAGGDSPHVTASTSAAGATYYVHQYYLTDDDQTYVVTFSFGENFPEDDAIDISESILASWSWED